MILLGQMMFVALVAGTSIAAAATERVDVWLVAAGVAKWSIVPLGQLLTGLVLVRGAAAGTVRALEAYFATHWPWSLWIIAVHTLFVAVPASRDLTLWMLATVVVPVGMTVRLLLGVCRTELGLSRARSRSRVVVHQILTILLLLGYVSFAVALWPRVVGLFA